MGVDVTLYPYHRPQWPASGPVIHMDKIRFFLEKPRLLSDLLVEGAKPIPARVILFLDEEGGTLTKNDGYGSPLHWKTAGDLVKIQTLHPERANSVYRMAWMGLKKLRPSTPVILYWS